MTLPDPAGNKPPVADPDDVAREIGCSPAEVIMARQEWVRMFQRACAEIRLPIPANYQDVVELINGRFGGDFAAAIRFAKGADYGP